MARKKIAIIGSGISGISAAYYLGKAHDVELFEKRKRLGGHTHTYNISSGPDAGIEVDTGFIVLNDKTYPNLHNFLKELEVPVRFSDMSFAFHSLKNPFAYAGTGLAGLFAKKSNITSLAFWKFLAEIKRFSKQALYDIENDNLNNQSIGEYLAKYCYGANLIDRFILPMGAAIWSTPADNMLHFPAKTFLYFFKNHGLLAIKDRPKWQTVVGGSHAYVHAFEKKFEGLIHRNTEVKKIERNDKGALLYLNENKTQQFDIVVIAIHANHVYQLLSDPREEETRAYKNWQYNKNKTVLHSDTSILPSNKKLWASWNYLEDKNGILSVSYHMNRLQGLHTEREYLVSLNTDNIKKDLVYATLDYEHPLYTQESIASQESIKAFSGKQHTYYAGAYLGYGFHEDGIRSGLEAVRRIEEEQ